MDATLINTLNSLTPLLLKSVFVLFLILISLIKHREKQTIKRLTEQNLELTNNLLFALAVEERHCRIHKENINKSLRNTVRQEVQVETNFEWNSRYSQSYLLRLKKQQEKTNVEQGNFLLQLIQNITVKASK